MITIGLLVGWALVFAALAIRAYYKGPRFLYYAFRPLAMSLIIALVVEVGTGAPPAYRLAVGAGLAASFIGDLFMMLRRKRFAAGLTAFLVAQVLYSCAFLSGIRLRLSPAPTAVLIAYGAVLFAILSPKLGRMRVPVALYILAISAMALAAMERYLQTGSPSALAACVGAVLFLASDSILAIDRFARPFGSAQAFILSTYYAAQALIALSVCL
jgi:uncharacterized membrane protein YhhN